MYFAWYDEKEQSYFLSKLSFWQGVFTLLFNKDKTVKFVPWWRVKKDLEVEND